MYSCVVLIVYILQILTLVTLGPDLSGILRSLKGAVRQSFGTTGILYYAPLGEYFQKWQFIQIKDNNSGRMGDHTNVKDTRDF